MWEELLVRHCAPTLAGIKTASMFTCSFEDEVELREHIRGWNRQLTAKGLRMLVLRWQCGRALVYLYRPARLRCDLQQELACRLLRERGYGMETPERCVLQLIRRLSEGEDFPHEIGLFLGYPPEDVCGFIENRAEGCKCVGCWKVYGDAEAAQRLFAKYRKCTDAYCAQLARGKSIERLAVAG